MGEIMPEITPWTHLEELADENDIRIRKDDSGRGMFGKTCFGIVGDLRDFARFLVEIVPQLSEEDNDVIDWTEVEMDSMGRQWIFYWRYVQWPDETEIDES